MGFGVYGFRVRQQLQSVAVHLPADRPIPIPQICRVPRLCAIKEKRILCCTFFCRSNRLPCLPSPCHKAIAPFPNGPLHKQGIRASCQHLWPYLCLTPVCKASAQYPNGPLQKQGIRALRHYSQPYPCLSPVCKASALTSKSLDAHLQEFCAVCAMPLTPLASPTNLRPPS